MIHRQSGFAVIETFIIIVVFVGLAYGGYFVWHQNKTQAAIDKPTPVILGYNSPAVTTASAPTIANPSDLNQAMAALNNTDVAASATDNAQLGVQASGF